MPEDPSEGARTVPGGPGEGTGIHRGRRRAWEPSLRMGPSPRVGAVAPVDWARGCLAGPYARPRLAREQRAAGPASRHPGSHWPSSTRPRGLAAKGQTAAAT